MRRKCWTWLAVLAVLCVSGEAAMAQAGGGPLRVSAIYDIAFEGMSIGEFRLNSTLSSRDYQLNADASINILAGFLFNWKGKTTSNGLVTAGAPRPASYTFSYKTSDKHETINLGFTDNSVTRVSFNPPWFASTKRVPIQAEHLHNVVDPLSAIVLLAYVRTQKQKAEACQRTLPIFDGKMRYDLIFSYRGTRRVEEGNYKGPVYVCRVKYVQIAGHKPSKDNKELDAAAENTEVWMMPLADANLVVPYYISVPTTMGHASMKTTKFEVILPSKVRRVLVE